MGVDHYYVMNNYKGAAKGKTLVASLVAEYIPICILLYLLLFS